MKISINDITSINGEDLTLKEISEKYNTNITTVTYRYKKGYRDNDLIKKELQRGIERKLIEIDNKHYTYQEISKIYNININTLKKRYQKGIRGMALIQDYVKCNESIDILNRIVVIDNYRYTFKKVASKLNISTDTIEDNYNKGYRGLELLVKRI